MRDGLVQMADILNIQQVGEAPLLGIEGVPFLVGNPDELKVLQKYAMPEFVKIAPSTTRRSSTPCRGRRSTSTPRSRPTSSTG